MNTALFLNIGEKSKEVINVFRRLIPILLLCVAAIGSAQAARLTVVNPGKAGIVISEDGRIYCKQSTCSRQYTGMVVLYSNPALGFRLKAWRGACRRQAPICRVRMNRDQTVKVVWERDPHRPVKAKTASGTELGRVLAADDRTVSVLTGKSYSLDMVRASGTVYDTQLISPYFTEADCTGDSYLPSDWNTKTGYIYKIKDTPGYLWVEHGEGLLTSVITGSRYVDNRCEIEANEWPAAYRARYMYKTAGGAIVTNGDISTTGFDPAALDHLPLLFKWHF